MGIILMLLLLLDEDDHDHIRSPSSPGLTKLIVTGFLKWQYRYSITSLIIGGGVNHPFCIIWRDRRSTMIPSMKNLRGRSSSYFEWLAMFMTLIHQRVDDA